MITRPLFTRFIKPGEEEQGFIHDITNGPTLPAFLRTRWATDTQATARMYYDTVSHPTDTDGSQYAFSTANDTSTDTSNQFRVAPYLTPNTTYYYKLRSFDGTTVHWSPEQTYTTAADGVRTSHLLIIRVNFPDDLAAGPSDATINSQMTEVAGYVDEYSFGQSEVTWDLVPGIHTMPNNTSFYTALQSTSSSRRQEQIALDASALAATQGYNTRDYFQYVIWVPQQYDWSNAAYFSGVNGFSQMHLGIFSMDYLVQANLYTQGLGGESRANGCVPDGSTPLPCTPDVGGLADPFDMLGQEGVTANLNIKHKIGMGWLLPANVPIITGNGTYRVFAHDTEISRVADRIYGIRMPGYQSKQYWIEFRQSNPTNSVLINWGGLLLLDMVPASNGFVNAPLLSGQTFTDPDNRTVTFSATGGTTPSWVDLVVGGL